MLIIDYFVVLAINVKDGAFDLADAVFWFELFKIKIEFLDSIDFFFNKLLAALKKSLK
jgi:hypothetical protein